MLPLHLLTVSYRRKDQPKTLQPSPNASCSDPVGTSATHLHVLLQRAANDAALCNGLMQRSER